MEIFLLIVAFVFMALSFVGSIIPGLPGVPLAFIGLLIAQATERVDFSWQVSANKYQEMYDWLIG